MKKTTKAALVMMVFVITITSLLIKQQLEKIEKEELMAEMSTLEQQLETEEVKLQYISEDIDNLIFDLEGLLRTCKLKAEESLSAIVCSEANRSYESAQRYLDIFYIQLEELDKNLTVYQLAYDTASKLCSEINSIRQELDLPAEILQAVSLETKMTCINKLLDPQKTVATELTEKAQAYAERLYKAYYPLLVKLVACEAGSSYCSDEDQYYVMNVVENRIKSKYYPNNIYDVIFQKGQYAPTWDGSWKTKKPDERTTENVERYLSGDVDTDMPENVVYQAMFKQGSGVWKYVANTVDGGHYYCYR